MVETSRYWDSILCFVKHRNSWKFTIHCLWGSHIFIIFVDETANVIELSTLKLINPYSQIGQRMSCDETAIFKWLSYQNVFENNNNKNLKTFHFLQRFKNDIPGFSSEHDQKRVNPSYSVLPSELKAISNELGKSVS